MKNTGKARFGVMVLWLGVMLVTLLPRVVTGQLVLSGGKVGIGTASPTELLEVKSSSSNAYVVIDRGTNQHGGIAYREGGTTQWVFPFFRGWESDNLIVRDEVSDIDVMTFKADGSGNVGIGTATPQQKLDVNGQVQARNGYGETITLGGDATSGDFEINIASPSHNWISLWNASIASPANLGAGKIDVSDRITKSHSGATYRVIPIAYGTISPSYEEILTNNFSVNRDCDQNTYDITIDGEIDLYQHHATLVTFQYGNNAPVRIAQVGTVGGAGGDVLTIAVKDIWGSVQTICGASPDSHRFHFVVFRQ